MQTLGRFAIISGFVLVALVNVVMFAGVSALSEPEKIEIYGRIYLYALIIPLVSVSGVFLAMYLKKRRLKQLKKSGTGDEKLKNSNQQENLFLFDFVNKLFFVLIKPGGDCIYFCN